MTTDLGTIPTFWPDADTGVWVVAVTFGVVNGRAEATSLQLRPVTDEDLQDPGAKAIIAARIGVDEDNLRTRSPIVTASLLRRLPVGEHVTDARRSLAGGLEMRSKWAQVLGEDDTTGSAREAIDEPSTRTRYTTDHFERVAEIYTEAMTLGLPAPVQEVAARLRLTRGVAGKHVARARQLGMLPPTQRGRANAGGVDLDKLLDSRSES